MRNYLVVIDMQNDFVTGVLGTPEARAIVPKIQKYVEQFDGTIYFTKDEHGDNYLETQEGKNLPVPHCIAGSDGSEIVPELKKYASRPIKKNGFICERLAFSVGYTSYDEEVNVYFCGVCTDICVISNALDVKGIFPEVRVFVCKDLCAGTTSENHENALKAMECCHIKIIESGVK